MFDWIIILFFFEHFFKERIGCLFSSILYDNILSLVAPELVVCFVVSELGFFFGKRDVSRFAPLFFGIVCLRVCWRFCRCFVRFFLLLLLRYVNACCYWCLEMVAMQASLCCDFLGFL